MLTFKIQKNMKRSFKSISNVLHNYHPQDVSTNMTKNMYFGTNYKQGNSTTYKLPNLLDHGSRRHKSYTNEDAVLILHAEQYLYLFK